MSEIKRVTFAWNVNNKDFSIEFDASINEQHSMQADVTTHPVENGPNITDNIRPLARKLTLEVFATNTPIYPTVLAPSTAAAGTVGASGNTVTFSEEFNRVQDVYDYLTDAWHNGALINIFTTLQSYVNFAITNVAVPRSAESANAVRITVDLQEIILVTVNQVTTLAAKNQITDRGSKPAAEVPPAVAEQAQPAGSLLSHL